MAFGKEPPSDAEDMHARIPGSRVALLDAAHIANVEQARAFNDLVSMFISQKPSPVHG